MDFRLDEGPYRDLLDKLGNPQNHLPPAIHFAGTNGKGSTLAFMKSIFKEAGLSVHAYTSPHLLTFNERITLNGAHISNDKLLQYLDLIESSNNGAPVTFFEYTTALAFKAMANHPADICLIETGLGGRLDCSNVIERPLATIITSIGYDHMDWLGTNITDIAHEKAGIMKTDCPSFIAPQPYETDIRPVFDKKGNDISCPVYYIERIKNLPPLGLQGDHQKDNASTAVATIRITHPHITEGQIATGLRNAQWSARMEKVSDIPEIWFDCGHNADGANVIATQLARWKDEQSDLSIRLIIGLAADKDPNAFMAPLWAYCDQVVCVDLLNARNAQTAKELNSRILKHSRIPVTSAPSVKSALLTPFDGLTLICGSLYLYEQVKA